MQKQIVSKASGQSAEEIGKTSGYAPSAGLGFKILFTQGMSLKAGIDAWTSPISEDDEDNQNTPSIDYSGRIGLVFAL